MADDVDIPEHRPGNSPPTMRTPRVPRHPRLSGANCPAPPGAFVPRVDRRRCEGKSDCVAVCPYAVFEVHKIAEDEYQSLSVLARLKLLAHGKKTAYTPRADSCRACSLCVSACPEKPRGWRRGGPYGSLLRAALVHAPPGVHRTTNNRPSSAGVETFRPAFIMSLAFTAQRNVGTQALPDQRPVHSTVLYSRHEFRGFHALCAAEHP